MDFSDNLKKAMQELGLKQHQVCGMTGKSKASISQYLSGKHTPPKQVRCDIAVSLGLEPDYFEQNRMPVTIRKKKDGIPQLSVTEAARLLHMNHNTVRKGLQQQVFPWGYAIHTSENQWVYFINAQRFAEIEGVNIQ